MNELIGKGITAAAIVISAAVLSFGLKGKCCSVPQTKPANQYELTAASNAVYRLDKSSGRIDVIVPAAEGAYLIPVLQMNPAAELTKEDQEQWGKISVATSQYLRMVQGLPTLKPEEGTAEAAPATANKD